MQQLQSEPENKCKDCLYMELEIAPVKPDNRGLIERIWQREEIQPGEIDLHLTINFNEQWEDLIGGRVKFGLKGGELRLHLENGKAPYKGRNLAGELELSIQKERQKQESNERQNNLEGCVGDSKPGVKASASEKQTRGTTDKFQFSVCQVTTKGGLKAPAWAFEAETGDPILKGLLFDKETKCGVKLATVNVTEKPCRIKATFEVSKRDVYITEAEGIYPRDISRNKMAWIEYEIALWLLKTKLQPYMSRQDLQYV